MAQARRPAAPSISAALGYNRSSSMDTSFSPSRRLGLALHLGLILFFLIGSVLIFNQAARTPIGTVFALYLLALFGLAASIPLLTYRLYSLIRSSYSFRPGILRLTWGLRVEDIPLVDINWISPAETLEYRLPLPLLRWPGAILGIRRLDRRSHIEFMASQRETLLVIETGRNLYAISPEDPAAFLHAFQRASEAGYFDPVSGQSVGPGALVETAWGSRPARIMIGAAFFLAAGLAAWVILGINPQAGDRFPFGNTARLINGTQVFLLPVLNSFYFMFNLLTGLFFFRREETRTLSYLLWLASTLVAVLFYLAVYRLVY